MKGVSPISCLEFEKFTHQELIKFLEGQGLGKQVANLLRQKKVTGRLMLEFTRASLEKTYTPQAANELLEAVKPFQGGRRI